MSKLDDTTQELLAEIERLRTHLQEAEDTLEAIRTGGVDALVVSGPDGDRIYTLTGADTAYRVLFETMNEGAATLGSDGTILFCNNRFSEMLSKPMGSILGRSILSFVSAKDIPLAKAVLGRGLKEPMSVEIALKSEDGSLVQCNVSSNPFSVEGSYGISTVFTDLTEHKKREAIIEDLYNNAPCGYHSLDGDGVFVRINATEIWWLGYRQDEIVGKKKFQDVITEDSRKIFEKSFPAFKERGWIRDFECDMVRKDGSIFPALINATAVKDSSGNFVMSRATTFDVTGRKLAEQNLRESEERFRAIFRTAQDCMYLKDISFKITLVNPAVEKLFGTPASEIIGRRFYELFGEEESDQVRDIHMRLLKGASIEEEHTRNVNGTPFTFLETRAPLRDGRGDITGVLTIARDITERKKAERKISLPAGEYTSKAMRTTLELAIMAARQNSSILLLGESGSGKDYVAKYIHEHSSRSKGPYFSINCAAIPSELAESELFGHEKGAFTGAVSQKRGLLELAEGGTLLLNEIGELPPLLQAKLLTFLDTRQFTRVGGEKEITVNVRLLAATNRDLEKEVKEGRFRQDLFYRINVMSIKIPPLRERREDIPVLAGQLLGRLRSELQLSVIPSINPDVMEAFKAYHWPGNVREFRNVLERAVMLSDGPTINIADLDLRVARGRGNSDWSFTASFPVETTLPDIVDELTKSMLLESLRRYNGNKSMVAKSLGIARDSVYRHMKRFGIKDDGEDGQDVDRWA